MKAYLLLFKIEDGERQEIIDHIDADPSIVNWKAFFPTGIFLVSEKSAKELSEIIRKRFPNRFHLVTDVTRGVDHNGWLPKDHWDFINYPKAVN